MCDFACEALLVHFTFMLFVPSGVKCSVLSTITSHIPPQKSRKALMPLLSGLSLIRTERNKEWNNYLIPIVYCLEGLINPRPKTIQTCNADVFWGSRLTSFYFVSLVLNFSSRKHSCSLFHSINLCKTSARVKLFLSFLFVCHRP